MIAWLSPVAALIIITFSSISVLMSVDADAPNQLTVAVFPPSWDSKRVFAAAAKANVQIVDFGLTDWLLVINSADPNFADDLRAQGAKFFLKGSAARLCGG